MTPKEFVKTVYPEAILTDGWVTAFGGYKRQVRGIQIKNRWLVHNGYYNRGRGSDEGIWNAAWKVVERKMLRKLES